MLFGDNQIILQLFFFINTNNHYSLIWMFWIMRIHYNGKMPWILNCVLTRKQNSSDCFFSKGHKPMSCKWIFKMSIMLMVLWQGINSFGNQNILKTWRYWFQSNLILPCWTNGINSNCTYNHKDSKFWHASNGC